MINYASNRCKGVTRFVLEVEVYSLVLALDVEFISLDVNKEVTGETLEIDKYLEFKTLFTFFQRQGNFWEASTYLRISSKRMQCKREEYTPNSDTVE